MGKVFRERSRISRRTLKGRLTIRLIKAAPWVQALEWWHVGVAALVLAVGAGVAWKVATAPARADATAVATVNGTVVTEADLAVEGDDGGKDSRKRRLEAIIDRKLLAQAAAPAGIEAPAEAAAIGKRAQEVLLATGLARRIVDEVTVDDNAARAFEAAHPAMFAERGIVLVDGGWLDPAIAAGPVLREAVTIDQAVTALQRTGIAFRRERKVIDTGAIPAEIAAQLAKVPPGRLFMVPMGTGAMIGAVIERTPVVLAAATRLEQAREGAENAVRQARLAAALKALRAKSAISYRQ